MLAAIVVVLAVAEWVHRTELRPHWLTLTVVIGLAPTLLWRRTRPLLTVVIAFAVSGVAPWLLPGDAPDMYVMVYFLILPYALFRWGSGREIVLGFALILAVGIVIPFAVGRLVPGDALGGAVVVFGTVSLATAIRYRSRVRVRELEHVRLLERERLARDLHDTVAHHFSAIAIRAQAGLATAATSSHAPVEALRVIDAEASRALAEMRAIVRVLRQDEPASLTPNPGIADLPALCGQPGTVVEVSLEGDFDGVPPAVGTAIYRLAQESITNARRHARHATRIDVRVRADEGSVYLDVSDDGDVSSAGAEGFGLVGMRERTHLLGGTFSAGPQPRGGWLVKAVVPRMGTQA